MMAEIEVDEVIGDEDAGSSQGIKMEEIEHTVCPTLLQMAMMNDTNRVKKTDIFDLITKPKRRGRPRKHSDFMTICSNKLDDTSQFEIQQLIEAKTMTEVLKFYQCAKFMGKNSKFTEIKISKNKIVSKSKRAPSIIKVGMVEFCRFYLLSNQLKLSVDFKTQPFCFEKCVGGNYHHK